ncbi:hypothetical protein N8T08_010773 [Aspergillus melleus]|uniref:Uncharacterized protein n=1 Tax=Aspergillus melleus TaxID=138277 RepID=A0ACC3BBW2_9EURO|nr:hypothetical protein N8T08_010773 [Aspergillus melleus]
MGSNMSPEELLEMPAGSPPPGQQSNLKDPPNLETAGHTVLLFFWISASILFVVRMYTKLFVIRKVKLSDYSIILAWGIFMGYLAPAWLLAKVGPGVDQWNISLKNFISVLFLRIWGLHMPLHKKIAVSAVFFVGIFACVSSVVRLAYTVHLYQTDNKSYYSYLAGVWTLPELASGIIVACLPVIPRFIQHLPIHTSIHDTGHSKLQVLWILRRASAKEYGAFERGCGATSFAVFVLQMQEQTRAAASALRECQERVKRPLIGDVLFHVREGANPAV